MNQTPVAIIYSSERNEQIQSRELCKRLGVSRLPADGMPERNIDGIRVYVRPLLPAVVGSNGRTYRPQSLRVIAICECGQHVAVSRLQQHRHTI